MQKEKIVKEVCLKLEHQEREIKDKAVTTTKQGKKELRVLQEFGVYVKYKYLDIATNKELSKYSLILKPFKTSDWELLNSLLSEKQGLESFEKQHLFVIPLKNGKFLITKTSVEDKQIFVWSPELKRVLKI